MTRDVSAAMQAAIEGGDVPLSLFYELLFDSGPLRAWAGIGNIEFNGATYFGFGDLLKVEFAEETSELSSFGGTMTLSGVPESEVERVLSEPYQGRPATAYLATFDANGDLIDFPLSTLEGRMDVMTLVDGESATIELRIEGEFLGIKKPTILLYTHQAQQAKSPGDLGLDRVASLFGKEVPWGQT